MGNSSVSVVSAPNVALEFLWPITEIGTPVVNVVTPNSRKNKGSWGSMDILGASGSPFLKKAALPVKKGFKKAPDPGSNPGEPAEAPLKKVPSSCFAGRVRILRCSFTPKERTLFFRKKSVSSQKET